LQTSKLLEKVCLALFHESTEQEDDDAFLKDLNEEESALLGELLSPDNDDDDDNNAMTSIQDALEELADFLDDPAMFMDAIEMGLEIPPVEDIQNKAKELRVLAVQKKKAGDMQGAQSALRESKHLAGCAQKISVLMEKVERKKQNEAQDEMRMEDLEAMLDGDGTTPSKKRQAAASAKTEPKPKSLQELKQEIIQLRDSKKMKEAAEVMKLYKAALKREKDAAELKRREELVKEIKTEMDYAKKQVRIFNFYRTFVDAESEQETMWEDYIAKCKDAIQNNTEGGGTVVEVSREDGGLMSVAATTDEDDFNALMKDLIEDGSNTEDGRLEIAVMGLEKLKENTNLQKLIKKKKREKKPDYPFVLRVEVVLQLPPNEHETDKSIHLVFDSAIFKKEKEENEESALVETSVDSCTFDTAQQYVDLGDRGNSPYAKLIRRRVERNKKIQISVHHVPVAPTKKGWLWSSKPTEEPPQPTLLGKMVFETQALMAKRCIAAGLFPLMNGSCTKALGGELCLVIRTGLPIGKEEVQAEPSIATLEPYKSMVFLKPEDES